MHPSLRIALLLVAAAVLGWFARSARIVDVAPAPAAAPAASEAPAHMSAEQPARIQRPALAGGSLGSRNLFAYRERVVPPSRTVVAHVPVLPPEPVVAQAVEAAPAPPPAPRFPWRFIGSFGTRERRLAAFSRDGEVITAREGQKVGGEFVLRSIGLESVEVQPAGFPVQRVALGD